MEKIAVIVTVYNIQDYIETCLFSILEQKYKNIELIVVDDGSTDCSGQICDNIARDDTRVKVIHQENQGPILARLHGVELASAEYVTFVDGDDWIDENVYQDIVDSGYLGTVDLISFGINRFRGENDIYAEPYVFGAGVYSKEKLFEQLIPRLFWDIEKSTYGLDPSLWSKIFDRTLLLEHLQRIQYLNIHYGEDIALLYPLVLEVNSIGIINERYYYHRIRKHNNVPPYISDKAYYSKLFSLYQYLQDNFQKDVSGELLKQLDYFYMYSVELGKLRYNDLAFENHYLFPFHKVPQNCRLVLYGAGRVGQTFFKQLKRIDYCKLIGWVDRDYRIYSDLGVEAIERLMEWEFDYVLISIAGKETAERIISNLLAMGIQKEKVIWQG